MNPNKTETSPKEEELKQLCKIGDDYYYGTNGVKQSFEKAVEYFRKAADLGYAKAQCDLGFCYEHGLGVPLNYTLACEWYQKAADQGETFAKDSLRHLHCLHRLHW